MSLSLDSWENVSDQVARLFSRGLTPYYNDHQHIPMLLQIIGELLGRSSFTYVRTNVPLPEPICTVNRRIYISIPLVALYINQPVRLPELKVKIANNFDVFDYVRTIEKASPKKKVRYDFMNCKRLVEPKRSRRYPDDQGRDSRQPFLLEDPAYSNTDGDGNDNFSNSDLVALIQIFRLVIMVHHWWKHRLLDTCFDDHESFEEIEMARRDVRYANGKAIKSIQGSCLKTVGNYCYDNNNKDDIDTDDLEEEEENDNDVNNNDDDANSNDDDDYDVFS